MDFFVNSLNERFTLGEIAELIEKDCDYGVYVGTDSHVHGKTKGVLYVSCIVLHKKGKGGRVFLKKEWESYTDSLRMRLTQEVWRSVSLALSLSPLLPSSAELVIDLDLNKDHKYKSSSFVQELVGFVVGQSFKCRVKPHSWAATSVADKWSR